MFPEVILYDEISIDLSGQGAPKKEYKGLHKKSFEAIVIILLVTRTVHSRVAQRIRQYDIFRTLVCTT